MMKKSRFKVFLVLWFLVMTAILALILITPAPEIKKEHKTWSSSVELAPPEAEPVLEGGVIEQQEPIPLPPPSEPVLSVPESAGISDSSTLPGERARIAIIIDDMGLGKSTQAIMPLPAEVTLSFLPYASDLKEKVRQVLEQGHEVMLHLPMEPTGFQNPGPDALLTSLPLDEISLRVSRALASFEGYVGVNNHMGSKFTKYRAGMELVVQAIRERGLYFVDSRTDSGSLAGEIAKEAGLKVALRDVFLDDKQDASAIREQFNQLEKIALKNGVALAIGHPHALTLSILAQWLGQASARGFRIVPVSEILR